MASATLRILLLALVLTATSPVMSQIAQAPGVVTPAEPTEVTETATVNGEDDGQLYQILSTLGALTLGIIGLLWVRRHTAEL